MPYAVARRNISRANRLTGETGAMAAAGAAGLDDAGPPCALAAPPGAGGLARRLVPRRPGWPYEILVDAHCLLPGCDCSVRPGQVRLSTCARRRRARRAAWCWRMASSSGASSRQYTFPSGLWYSSTWRTPNRRRGRGGRPRRSARGPRRAASGPRGSPESCHVMLLSLCRDDAVPSGLATRQAPPVCPGAGAAAGPKAGEDHRGLASSCAGCGRSPSVLCAGGGQPLVEPDGLVSVGARAVSSCVARST